MRKWCSKLWIAVIASVAATGALAVLGVGESAAQYAHSIPDSSDKPDATYLWTAELVAFDEPSNTVTVTAMLVTNPEATDISALQPGDRAVITWYGLWTAAGVRAVRIVAGHVRFKADHRGIRTGVVNSQTVRAERHRADAVRERNACRLA